MNTRAAFMPLFVTLLLACAREVQVIVVYQEDEHYIDHFFQQYNIPSGYPAGELRSSEMLLFTCSVDDAGNVTPGDTIAKVAGYFDRDGYLLASLAYTIPPGETNYTLTLRVDYSYDGRHRVTSQITTTPEPMTITRESKVYTYDDKKRVALEVTSISIKDGPCTVTGERVYPLKQTGFIDDNFHEEITRSTPVTSRAFIVLDTDDHDLWTIAYARYVLRDLDGNITETTYNEYFQRVNTYFPR